MALTLLCANCFKPNDIEDETKTEFICPHCEYPNTSENVLGALPTRSKLNNRYLVGRVKSSNAESFNYLAFDENKNEIVEIQELFPIQYVKREENHVVPIQEGDNVVHRLRSKFLSFANFLLGLKNREGVIPVIEILNENSTFYIVYKHIESVSFAQFVNDSGGKITYDEVRELFLPITNILDKMHSAGFSHLGININSIRYCSDNKLRLSDFSTKFLRRTGDNIYEANLKDGFSAYEQYISGLTCSSRTDIYSLASVIFYALSGEIPSSAQKRHYNPKLMIDKEVLAVLPQNAIKALSGAMQVQAENRTSHIELFEREFFEEGYIAEKGKQKAIVSQVPKYKGDGVQKTIPPVLWLILSFVISIFFIGRMGITMMENGEISFEGFFDFFYSDENKSSALIKLPELEDSYYIDWADRLENDPSYKFTLEVEEVLDEEVAQGKIISSEPEGGSFVEMDSVVSVKVSLGPKIRRLPNINGMPFEDAEELLLAEGLVIIIEESYSKDIPKGNVLWYGGDFNSYQEVEYGSSIPVIVSTGN